MENKTLAMAIFKALESQREGGVNYIHPTSKDAERFPDTFELSKITIDGTFDLLLIAAAIAEGVK